VSVAIFTAFSAAVQNRIADALAGKVGARALKAQERQLLIVLQPHIGKHDALSLYQLCDLLQTDQRSVKGIVSDLRRFFRLQIGASRDEGGYYMIATPDEARESTANLEHQAITMLRVVSAMRGRHVVAEMLGQFTLDLEREEDEETRHAA
jgi:hypothetical protein